MKTAIVTGAAGNLGQAVVRKFLSEDYNVIGTVEPGHILNTDHKNLEIVEANLMNEEAASDFIAGVIQKHNQIDAAFLTVGGFAMGKIADTKTSDIFKQYKLNFETAYNTARPLFNQMLQQGSGRIFMIGSRPGSDMRFGKGMIGYAMAKSLIFRLAELMNEEAKGTNVVTNVIVPSTIDTPENRKSMPTADYSKWVTAEQIADIIFTYCTPSMSITREPIIKVYNNA
jgi:NAD(P)-dependent dehydrogenase (short-subunit alcohol dehydrogenase family)